MANRLGEYSVVAAVMLALLAGRTTDSVDQSRVVGAGSGSRAGTTDNVVRPPALSGPQRFVVDVAADRVFFDVDKSELKPEARERSERWAAWMRQYPSATLTIEGHCDERSTREYNLALGAGRVAAGPRLSRIAGHR